MKLFPPSCKTPIIVIIIIGVVIAIGYFLYVYAFSQNIIHTDPFNKSWFSVGPIQFGFWPLSHFILYLILGFLFPECWLILMILGIIWEGIEFLTGVLLEKEQKHRNDVLYSGKWWRGNLYDPLFNGLGLLTGWYISTLVKNK